MNYELGDLNVNEQEQTTFFMNNVDNEQINLIVEEYFHVQKLQHQNCCNKKVAGAI